MVHPAYYCNVRQFVGQYIMSVIACFFVLCIIFVFNIFSTTSDIFSSSQLFCWKAGTTNWIQQVLRWQNNICIDRLAPKLLTINVWRHLTMAWKEPSSSPCSTAPSTTTTWSTSRSGSPCHLPPSRPRPQTSLGQNFRNFVVFLERYIVLFYGRIMTELPDFLIIYIFVHMNAMYTYSLYSQCT